MKSQLSRMLVMFVLLIASPSFAVDIFRDTFESYSTSGDGCTELLTNPTYSMCKEVGVTSDISIVTSIPGYSGAFPSGTKMVRMYATSPSVQTEVGLRIGSVAGTTDFIPPSVCFQYVLYVNHFGSELSTTSNRPAKLVYPMRATNGGSSCPLDGSTGGCQWILEGVKHDSYNPFRSAALSGTNDGSMFVVARDMYPTTDANWSGSLPGDENKLGQTDLSEWIKPNRMNVIRVCSDASNTSAIGLNIWIGEMGSALTNVLSWRGGTTVAGFPFTWSTSMSPVGHKLLMINSTVPANDATGTTLYMYYDDFVVATSVDDLPTYMDTSTSRFSIINLRRN